MPYRQQKRIPDSSARLQEAEPDPGAAATDGSVPQQSMVAITIDIVARGERI